MTISSDELTDEEVIELRAYVTKAVLTGQDAKTTVAKVYARWGAAAIPILEDMDEEALAALPRDERRRLERRRRKRR